MILLGRLRMEVLNIPWTPDDRRGAGTGCGYGYFYYPWCRSSNLASTDQRIVYIDICFSLNVLPAN